MTEKEQEAQEIKEAQEVTTEPEAQEVTEAQEGPTSSDNPINGQLSIFIDDNIKPELDPNSPQFDPAAYKKALEEAGGQEELNRQFTEAVKVIARNITNAAAKTVQTAARVSSAINGITNSDAFKLLTRVSDYIVSNQESFKKADAFYTELGEDTEGKDPAHLLFYIRQVLEERGEKMPPVEFLEYLSPSGEPLAEWAEEILTEARKRMVQARPSSRELAMNEGAIMDLAGSVATIANENLKAWASPDALKQLPEGIKALFDEETGKLNEISLQGEPLQPLENVHVAFLMALLQVAAIKIDLREYNSRTNSTIPLYLPGFFKDTNIDPRPRERTADKKELAKRSEQTAIIGEDGKPKEIKDLRRDKFLEFIRPFVGRVGIIPGEGYYSIASFDSWDENSEIAYISIPYELKLIEKVKLSGENHAISNIFHANILAEPKAAVELANRIAVGVIERGVTRRDEETYKSQRKPQKETIKTQDKDGNQVTVVKEYDPPKEPETEKAEPQERRITWACKFDTLIKDCPQLQTEIAKIRKEVRKEEAIAVKEGKPPEEIRIARAKDHKTDPQRINKKLKDTFDAAIRIILEKSKMPEYYKDLKIKTGRLNTYKAPTNSTLKERLIISHKGKNPNYSH